MLGRRRHQFGLSLVELMVGVAVGLLVVAGAATVTATQLSDSRRLVVEAQVQQDLRATADIMTRELRRAGSWIGPGAVPLAVSAAWSPTAAFVANPVDTVTLTPTTPPATEVSIQWQKGAGPTTLGFRLSGSAPGVLQLLDSGGTWQALTDAATVDITAFQIVLVPLAAVQMACSQLCADGTQACWPTVEVRELQFQITGRAVSDPYVVRTINSGVRLHNDRIVNNNTAGTPPTLCP